jgi:Linalool dehydratase/isomerase
MTIAEVRPPATEPFLLPERPPRLGPVSRRLLLRLVAILLSMQIIGAWLTFGVATDRARAAGLSLTFPAGGFLFAGLPGLFVVTMALLALAVIVWWGASAHFAIPLVWLSSVVVAALLVHGPKLFVAENTTWPWTIAAVYALAIGCVALAVTRVERRYQAKLAKVPELNDYLRTAVAPTPLALQRPADPMDVELLRWCYAIAFQPADGLDGLDWGEQFHSGTQLRYQLNALCWALSMYAVNFVPNAPAQVEAALSKLIEKHTDLRVWGYWRTLNLLGNFDPNPDPIVRDNIMFSAFLGDVLNIFEAATGSTRFDRPGSLTFVWKDGRTFEYDHHSIAAAVENNFQRSKLGFFPCEPGWSFTVCNIMGAQSLRGHDTIHGTSAWDRVQPRFAQTLDNEYYTPDGSYAHIRSSHVGLSWDTGEVPGGHYFAQGSNRFADILPGHAKRAAALDRRSAAKVGELSKLVNDGRLELELPLELERHRAGRSALGKWNGIIGGAKMLADEKLHAAAIDASARQCATGERWPSAPLKAGVPAMGGNMILRWSNPVTTAQLNVRGYRAPQGPVLDVAPRDHLLVVEARSPDGISLELRVEPMDAPLESVGFAFRQLAAGATYADADGVAHYQAPVLGPTTLEVRPS